MLYQKEYSCFCFLCCFCRRMTSHTEMIKCSLGRVKLHCTICHSRNSRSLKNTKSKDLDRKNGLMKQMLCKLLSIYNFYPTIESKFTILGRTVVPSCSYPCFLLTLQLYAESYKSAIVSQHFPHFDIIFGWKN